MGKVMLLFQLIVRRLNDFKLAMSEFDQMHQ